MQRNSVVTPEHPLWNELLSRLSHTTFCRGTTTHARLVLTELPGIDVEESLRALAALGGGCDCAIEFDIAPRRGARAERIEGAA